MAMRTGTPLSSYSANFQPGVLPSLVSNFTLMPLAFKSLMSGCIFSEIAASCPSFLKIGTMTTWIGASLGGSTKPSSSECAMISAPIRRVLTPHEVPHTYSSLPSLLANLTSNALAKFCPRKCDVPACNALPSCIRASMQYVSSAPANRSLAVFTPRTTGKAIHCSAKVAYTSSIWRVSATASSAVAWAVWPSCHRNSAVRRNSRVRISQRTTFAHWLMSSGRSR